MGAILGLKGYIGIYVVAICAFTSQVLTLTMGLTVSEMISNITSSFVTYYITQQVGSLKPSYEKSDSNSDLDMITHKPESNPQRLAVRDYIANQSNARIIAEFTEIADSKKNNVWPELKRAITQAKLNNAILIIAELGNLTSNKGFTDELIASNVRFHCCDQPFVTQEILVALCKHAQVQRQLHGKLIREGLKMTSAKSGNPNAARVIKKVNKPKIDTAIVFACLLQPIITDYRRKGFSQRHMVKSLNEEGFTAPEGGKWVLSQLQKVLDRVRLNEIALEHRETINELRAQDMSNAQIAAEFNTRGISSLKRSDWDESQIKKLISRIDQITEIEHINEFLLNLLPIVREYRQRGETIESIIHKFSQIGLTVRSGNEEVAA